MKESAWIGGDREGWERVPYWLDGFIPLAYLLEDDDMIARTKKYVDAIERPTYTTWAILLITKVPQSLEPVSEEEEMELYPYGCATLRITELPKI